MPTALASPHAASRTTSRHQRGAAIVLGFVAAFAAAGTSIAQTRIEPAPPKWTLSESFKKNEEARTNISGAACVSFSSCIVVNDQKKYAQFFSIDGTVIRPGKVIRLVGDEAKGDPDAEGAAYDAGYFYITGSHGRSRHHPKDHNDPSYLVFRFPVDASNGNPAFDVSEGAVVGVESSSRLREAIKDKLADFYDEPLDENGVNIEGIAVKDGRMYLGFRGPSKGGHAFVISVDAKAVFTDRKKLHAKVAKLKLGPDTGIRDLAAVSNGLLILSGPVNEQDVTPAIRHWDPETGALSQPRELVVADKSAKAETLLVLKDSEREPWRVLVMFDGPSNGDPTEYLVPR